VHLHIAYSEVRVTETSEQLSKVDQSDYLPQGQRYIIYM